MYNTVFNGGRQNLNINPNIKKKTANNNSKQKLATGANLPYQLS